MDECTLYELDPDLGKVYISSGPEMRMIEGGRKIARDNPPYVYLVERDGVLIWNSKDNKEADTVEAGYRLVRLIGGVAAVIAPGARPEHLIKAGKALAAEHPDWTLLVQDAELSPVWQNEKDVPGKAEDATQNG